LLRQLATAIVVANDVGDVCHSLLLLPGQPTEISAGKGGFHEILDGGEFPIEVQQ
jgi:hypothetical protein